MLLEGANFDPEHFPNPGSIELDRPNPTSHLAFGRGQHFCPDQLSVAATHRSASKRC